MSTAGPAARYQRTYHGRADQLRQVRHDLARYLADCPAVDDAVMIAGELAANAMVCTPPASAAFFTVRCHDTSGRVWIEVEDLGGPSAARSDSRPHGLDIIQALVGPGEWGTQDTSGGGRIVWTRLDLPRETTAGQPPPGTPLTGPADARTAPDALPGPAAGQPRRLLQDMTTRDLSRHRHQLDQALKHTTTDNPAREEIQRQLTLIHAILRTRSQAPAAQHCATARPLRPSTYDLTARIFRGLFTDFDLHNTSTGYVAVPKGIPLFTGTSLGDLARQISHAINSGPTSPGPTGPR